VALRVDEDLLDLGPLDHREADDLAVDLGHRRVGDAGRAARVEGVEGAGRGQAGGHVPGMSHVPGTVPDDSDSGHVAGLRGSDHDLTLGLHP
jgi:hypothetical protein